VQNVSLAASPRVIVRAVAASAPLRKGFVPTPTLDALIAVASQPVIVEPQPVVESQPVVEAAPQPEQPVEVVTVEAPIVEAPIVEDELDLGLGVTLSYDLSQDQ
jgi:hypothetical protein